MSKIPTLTSEPRRITVTPICRRDLVAHAGEPILRFLALAFIGFAIAGTIIGFLASRP